MPAEVTLALKAPLASTETVSPETDVTLAAFTASGKPLASVQPDNTPGALIFRFLVMLELKVCPEQMMPEASSIVAGIRETVVQALPLVAPFPQYPKLSEPDQLLLAT